MDLRSFSGLAMWRCSLSLLLVVLLLSYGVEASDILEDFRQCLPCLSAQLCKFLTLFLVRQLWVLPHLGDALLPDDSCIVDGT